MSQEWKPTQPKVICFGQNLSFKFWPKKPRKSHAYFSSSPSSSYSPSSASTARLESHPPLGVAMAMTWFAHNLKPIGRKISIYKEICPHNQNSALIISSWYMLHLHSQPNVLWFWTFHTSKFSLIWSAFTLTCLGPLGVISKRCLRARWSCLGSWWWSRSVCPNQPGATTLSLGATASSSFVNKPLEPGPRLFALSG